MENHRLVIAVVLSFGLLFGWQIFSQYMGWAPKPAPTTAQMPPADAPAPVPAAEDAQPLRIPAAPPSPGRDVVVETPLYTAVFNSAGGTLKDFALKKYQNSDPESSRPSGKALHLLKAGELPQGAIGLFINNQSTWPDGQKDGPRWSYAGESSINLREGELSIHFDGLSDGLVIRRTFILKADAYVLRELVRIGSESARSVNIVRSLSTGELSGDKEYSNVTKVVLAQGGEFLDETDKKRLAAGMNYGERIQWAGAMSSYFLTAVIPQDQTLNLRAIHQNENYTLLLEKKQVSLEPGQDFSAEFSYYIGPKLKNDLEAAPADLSPVMEYGWFGWIASPLLIMLRWFHALTGNWGTAIILLTVVIKIVLWPLSYRSYKSMENMKKLQPIMTKIREKYKDDRQRQNQEVMQLYKTYKVNPMGGCLPILVQLPVFFGLYRALLSSIELRHAGFIEFLPFTDIVWLADLSAKDPLYITPIVMGISMLLQQKMTPTTGDPTQAKIMMLMPIVFTFMFITFPSGLVIYWLFNNIISIAQQHGQMKLSSRKQS
ncbi:MAG: membrane protein insertase YidC [Deltaproteobacteria bacterium]|jgi:YidC/Oxa1 family membrane protein insertase|nr:membrane protein insertase YidC [Deltaproteobacteria bacterium]